MIPRIHLLLICLIPLNSFAQNFAPPGASWHYSSWIENFGDYSHFEIFSTAEDSIGDIACSSLHWFDFDIGMPEASVVVCESNGKVYFNEGSGLKLLFDFTLEVNDTLIFSVPSVQPYYEITCCNDPSEGKYARSIITAVSDTVIDGYNLKIFETEMIFADEDDPEFFMWNLGTIIERIGSMHGMFGYGETCCLAGISGEIRCYEDAEIFAKFVDYDCVSVDIENELLNQIIVTPTITTGELNIILSGNNLPDEINILNINGAFVYSGSFQTNIDISYLHPGVYIIQLTKGNVVLLSEKIIKINE